MESQIIAPATIGQTSVYWNVHHFKCFCAVPPSYLYPMRLFFAFRVFFIVLFRRDSALRIRDLLNGNSTVLVPTETPRLSTPAESKPITAKLPAPLRKESVRRSEALTLLSALQRESRLLDLVSESLDPFSDAQIGAAARDVLRDTRKSLDRIFGLQHLIHSPEGDVIEIPSDASTARWRIVGKESGDRGTLSHPGWQATKLDMPQWSGNADDSMVIAAAEVET